MIMKNNQLEAKAINLAGLIQCQDDSVVSRQIIKKDSGSITLFAFGKGQGLSEHTAPFEAVVSVLEGEAEVVISGTKHLVKKNQTIIMPANIAHQIYAPVDFKMLLVMIR